jgi:hypothetical protein
VQRQRAFLNRFRAFRPGAVRIPPQNFGADPGAVQDQDFVQRWDRRVPLL